MSPFPEILDAFFRTHNDGTRAFVDGVPLVGIFDRLDVTALDAKGYRPILFVQKADAPSVAEGSEVWIEATRFAVVVIDDDGLGVLKLHLKLDAQVSGEGVAWGFDQGYFRSPQGELMNDHGLTFVEETGLWHVHAIKGLVGTNTGSAYFSHRTTRDLGTWTQLADIQLGTGINLNWNAQVWAPQIIRNPCFGKAGNSTALYRWLMFFTGADFVTTQPSTMLQKIGVAGCTDNDLASWTILNGGNPIYWAGMDDTPNGGSYPSGAPWSSYAAASYRGASRDPDVFFDGTDYWLAMTAVGDASVSYYNVIGLAKFNGGSTPDFLKLRHNASKLVAATASGSWRLESSRVLKRLGLWNIFVKGTDGTRHQSDDAFLGPPWSGSGAAGDAITNGLNEETFQSASTTSAEAAEIEEIEDGLFIASGHRIVGSGGTAYSYHQYHVLAMNEVDVQGDNPTSRHMGLIRGIVGTNGGLLSAALRWTVLDSLGSNGAFWYQPVRGDQAAAAGYAPSGMDGDAYVATHFRHFYPWASSPWQSGAEWTNYSRKGAIRSSTFRVTRDRMSLKVGGGNNRYREFVALVNADDGRLLCIETGEGTHTLKARAWDLTDFRGLDVYLLAADLGTATMDCLAFDSIREYLSTEEADPDPAAADYAIGEGPLASELLALGGIS